MLPIKSVRSLIRPSKLIIQTVTIQLLLVFVHNWIEKIIFFFNRQQNLFFFSFCQD